MNKKFSTLMMAGMLVAGSSFVDAQTLNGLKLKQIDFQAGGKNTYKDVVVVRDVNNDGKIDVGDIIMTASKRMMVRSLMRQENSTVGATSYLKTKKKLFGTLQKQRVLLQEAVQLKDGSIN